MYTYRCALSQHMDINYTFLQDLFFCDQRFSNTPQLSCVYLTAVCGAAHCSYEARGDFLLLLQSVRLAAARRLLAELQPIDGQSVGSSAQVALLSFALHVAFAI